MIALRDALKRLPDWELEIMIVLWDTKVPVSLSYISQRLRGKKKCPLANVVGFGKARLKRLYQSDPG